MVLAELIVLVIFISILSKSAEVVVRNATKLAQFFGVSQLAVGILLVAAATTLPELSVSVAASVTNQGAIAAGNVFGSNIANLLLLLGIGAFLYGFRVSRDMLPEVGLVLLITTLISVYIIYHSQIAGNALGFVEGAVLLLVAAFYVSHILSKKGVKNGKAEAHVTKQEGLSAFLRFFVGIVGIIISSHFAVDSAVKLAEIAGLSQSFIGATIIAIGTSLPELSVILQAIKRKHYGIALGDALGANMINLTFVLGVASAINPITVQLSIFIAALLFAVVANMFFFYTAAVKRAFGRLDGTLMVLMYVLYVVAMFYLQFGGA
ncbi:MAG: sodium:calcium antiporter [archaeon]